VKVIGIIGPRIAGKETVAKYISEKYNAAVHSHSEILDDVLKVLELPLSRENEIRLVALRATFGDDVLINALSKRVRSEISGVVVVTGVRFQNEFDNVRSFPQNTIISVAASLETRYLWQQSRGDKAGDIGMSFEDFAALDHRVTEQNISKLMASADYHIENNGTLEDLYAKVDAIMQNIR
jgi:dephospho-CoA kinase